MIHVVIEEPPGGAPAHDLADEPAVFAADDAPEEIAEIAQRLREQAGLPEIPTGQVASTTTGRAPPRRRPPRRSRRPARA